MSDELCEVVKHMMKSCHWKCANTNCLI